MVYQRSHQLEQLSQPRPKPGTRAGPVKAPERANTLDSRYSRVKLHLRDVNKSIDLVTESLIVSLSTLRFPHRYCSPRKSITTIITTFTSFPSLTRLEPYTFPYFNSIQKRPVPVLTQDNHERWFKLLERYFKGEGIWAAVIGTPMADREGLEKADAKAQYIIDICIDDMDRERVEACKDAKEMWDMLKKKYSD